MKRLMTLIACSMPMLALPAAAQTPPMAPPNTGTVILMTGTAEVEVPNDEAVASFFYEAQDADLTRAQGLVNQRVGDGTAALRRADPKADVETSGYSSFPVYSGGSARSIVGWRVRQGVTLRTGNLAALPRTVSSVQSYLALGGIDFRLSRAARDKVDADLIRMATANLNARFASAAAAMGAAPARLRVEEVNFGVREGGPQPMMMRQAPMMASDAGAPPPSFESGRSTERLTVSGKARLLP
ncbi:MAG: SIMPL domain-containing protein [Betaproteobacteria bacterium]